MTKDFKLLRDVRLQKVERERTAQAWLTVPSDLLNYLEWEKGDVIECSVVLGSGQLIFERKDMGLRK